MREVNSLNHTRWECKYHIVFIPKYRRKVLFGQVRKEMGKVNLVNCPRNPLNTLLVKNLLCDYRGQVFQDQSGAFPVNHADMLQRQLEPAEIDVLIDYAVRVVFFEQLITSLTVEYQ